MFDALLKTTKDMAKEGKLTETVQILARVFKGINELEGIHRVTISEIIELDDETEKGHKIYKFQTEHPDVFGFWANRPEYEMCMLLVKGYEGAQGYIRVGDLKKLAEQTAKQTRGISTQDNGRPTYNDRRRPATPEERRTAQQAGDEEDYATTMPPQGDAPF